MKTTGISNRKTVTLGLMSAASLLIAPATWGQGPPAHAGGGRPAFAGPPAAAAAAQSAQAAQAAQAAKASRGQGAVVTHLPDGTKTIDHQVTTGSGRTLTMSKTIHPDGTMTGTKTTPSGRTINWPRDPDPGTLPPDDPPAGDPPAGDPPQVDDPPANDGTPENNSEGTPTE